MLFHSETFRRSTESSINFIVSILQRLHTITTISLLPLHELALDGSCTGGTRSLSVLPTYANV
jgi:hypothetical protein